MSKILILKFDVGDTVKWMKTRRKKIESTCPICEGKGKIILASERFDEEGKVISASEEFECPKCKGRGKLVDFKWVNEERIGIVNRIEYDGNTILYYVSNENGEYELDESDLKKVR